jgi:hypothetical protein
VAAGGQLDRTTPDSPGLPFPIAVTTGVASIPSATRESIPFQGMTSPYTASYSFRNRSCKDFSASMSLLRRRGC